MQTDLAEMARQTPPGMAGIIATGPQGKTCRECSLWGGNMVEKTVITDNGQLTFAGKVLEKSRLTETVLERDHSRRRWVRVEPVPQSCMMRRRLQRAKLSPDTRSRRVAHDTPACSHFLPAGNPQPVCKPTP